jgi:hypothetical protein
MDVPTQWYIKFDTENGGILDMFYKKEVVYKESENKRRINTILYHHDMLDGNWEVYRG